MKKNKLNNLLHKDSLFSRGSTKVFEIQEKKKHWSEYTSKTLEILRTLTWLTGIAYTKPSDKRKFLSRNIWDISILLISFITYFLFMCGVSLFKIPQRTIEAVQCYQTSGFILRVMFFVKKRTIFSSIDNVFELVSCSRVHAQKHLKRVKIQVGLFIGLMLNVVCFMSTYSFVLETVDDKEWRMLTMKVEESKIPILSLCVRVSLLISTLTSTSILFMLLIICCNSYLRVVYAMQSFRGSFRKDVESKNIARNTLTFHTLVYRDMIKIFKSVENALSGICFFLYAISFQLFFLVMSLHFLNKTKDAVLILQILLCLFLGLIIFFPLTLIGTKPSSEYEKLKITIVDFSQDFSALRDNYKVLAAYKLLVDIINSNRVFFTGAYMFEINKALILSTGGTLVTYGVVLFS